MEQTLAHINERYGNLSHYLSSISFPLAAQQKLVDVMIVPESERRKKHARRLSKGIVPHMEAGQIAVGVPGNVPVGEVVDEIIDPHDE